MKYKLKLLVAWALLTLFISVTYAAQEMRPFAQDSLKRIVAEQRGKPFVLVVWSLDCSFCLTSLENLSKESQKQMQTQKKKKKRKQKHNSKPKLNIVTLSTDAYSDAEAMAASRKKLKSLRLTDNAWAFGDDSPEYLRFAIDRKWAGEKPRTYWFNARGERKAYSGVITPMLIEEFTAAN